MRPYRLDRMTVLFRIFGDPHRAMKTVHIAGSKGKGSTAVYIASALKAAGYSTGLYTSPHVTSYKERITLAGEEIDDFAITETVDEMRAVLTGATKHDLPGRSDPTTFELLTLLAFLLFQKLGCDWAVIETGIGGRLDATNLVSPEATVITPIELEHTDVLGTTLEAIASEKAGIFKSGVPVFSSHQQKVVEGVLRRKAAEAGASTFVSMDEELASHRVVSIHPGHTVEFTWSDRSIAELSIGMRGDVQAANAALAYVVCDYLLARGGHNDAARSNAITAGIAAGVLPGRMELVGENPPVFLDGAHTPSSVTRLVDSFVSMYPAPRGLIFGSVSGKNHEEMARILAPHFQVIVVSTPGYFKPSDPAEVFATFMRHHDRVFLEPDPSQALLRITDSSPVNTAVLVTGSFYMISEIRKLILDRPLVGT